MPHVSAGLCADKQRNKDKNSNVFASVCVKMFCIFITLFVQLSNNTLFCIIEKQSILYPYSHFLICMKSVHRVCIVLQVKSSDLAPVKG